MSFCNAVLKKNGHAHVLGRSWVITYNVQWEVKLQRGCLTPFEANGVSTGLNEILI